MKVPCICQYKQEDYLKCPDFICTIICAISRERLWIKHNRDNHVPQHGGF